MKHWTQAENATLREMFAAGSTDADIGHRLGRTFWSVKTHRLGMGLLQPDYGSGPPIQRPMASVPSKHLEPIYRPWSCRVSSSDADLGGDLKAWSAWLPMRARMVALEERDAARDARDSERFDVVLTPSGLVVRERAEVAA